MFGTHIPAGTIKRIHVDKHVIAANRKNGTNLPVFTIQTSRGSIKARDVRANGFVRFIQAGDIDSRGRFIKPLRCGARAWCETRSEIYYWD